MRSLCVLLIAVGCSNSKPAKQVETTLQVPGDTALFASVNVTKLRASSVWPRIESAITAHLPIATVRSLCSFDPLQKVETISLAVPAEFHPERMIAYASGVDRSVVDPCVKAVIASQNHTVTVKEENHLVAYREEDAALFAAWLDAKTVAVTPGDLSASERLQLLVDKRQPTDPLFTEQANKLATGHTLAFAFVAPPQTDMNAFMLQTGVEPLAGRGWLDLDSALRGEFTLRFESEARASTVAQDITKRATGDSSPVGQFLRGVRAKASGSDVVITLELDKATTDQAIEFFSH